MPTHSTELPIWIVYYDTKDIPGKYCTRMFLYEKPTNKLFISDTLEGIRKHIPEGLVRLPRFDDDDPKIIEVWI